MKTSKSAAPKPAASGGHSRKPSGHLDIGMSFDAASSQNKVTTPKMFHQTGTGSATNNQRTMSATFDVASWRTRDGESSPATDEYGSAEKAVKLTYNEDTRMWESEVVQVEIARAPFDRGIMHVVHKCLESAPSGEKVTRVAKFLDAKSLGMKITKQMYFDEAGAHLVSRRFAIEFNRKSSQLINFCDIHLLELIERPGKPMCRIEPLMTGVWVKHNNNNGAVLSTRMTPQAFSHFTYVESEGFLTVCDIQGCQNTFTDPQIHSKDGKGYGLGNLGEAGLKRFIRSHTCNIVCAAVGLPRLSAGAKASNWTEAEIPQEVFQHWPEKDQARLLQMIKLNETKIGDTNGGDTSGEISTLRQRISALEKEVETSRENIRRAELAHIAARDADRVQHKERIEGLERQVRVLLNYTQIHLSHCGRGGEASLLDQMSFIDSMLSAGHAGGSSTSSPFSAPAAAPLIKPDAPVSVAAPPFAPRSLKPQSAAAVRPPSPMKSAVPQLRAPSPARGVPSTQRPSSPGKSKRSSSPLPHRDPSTAVLTPGPRLNPAVSGGAAPTTPRVSESVSKLEITTVLGITAVRQEGPGPLADRYSLALKTLLKLSDSIPGRAALVKEKLFYQIFDGVVYLLDEKKFGGEVATESAIVVKNLLRTNEGFRLFISAEAGTLRTLVGSLLSPSQSLATAAAGGLCNLMSREEGATLVAGDLQLSNFLLAGFASLLSKSLIADSDASVRFVCAALQNFMRSGIGRQRTLASSEFGSISTSLLSLQSKFGTTTNFDSVVLGSVLSCVTNMLSSPTAHATLAAHPLYSQMVSVLVAIVCRSKPEDELCSVCVSAIFEVSKNERGCDCLCHSSLGLVFVFARILTNSVDEKRAADIGETLISVLSRAKEISSPNFQPTVHHSPTFSPGASGSRESSPIAGSANSISIIEAVSQWVGKITSKFSPAQTRLAAIAETTLSETYRVLIPFVGTPHTKGRFSTMGIEALLSISDNVVLFLESAHSASALVSSLAAIISISPAKPPPHNEHVEAVALIVSRLLSSQEGHRSVVEHKNGREIMEGLHRLKRNWKTSPSKRDLSIALSQKLIPC